MLEYEEMFVFRVQKAKVRLSPSLHQYLLSFCTPMPKTGRYYSWKDKEHVPCTPTKRALIPRMYEKERMTFAEIGAEFNMTRQTVASNYC